MVIFICPSQTLQTLMYTRRITNLFIRGIHQSHVDILVLLEAYKRKMKFNGH